MTETEIQSLQAVCRVCGRDYVGTSVTLKRGNRICKDCNRQASRNYRKRHGGIDNLIAEENYRNILANAAINLDEFLKSPDLWRMSDQYTGYAVRLDGAVMRVEAGKGSPAGYMLKPYLPKGQNYLTITLFVRGKTRVVLLNRVVCAAFHGDAPTSSHEAAHNDGNTMNNYALNLRWATPAENTEDKFRHGTVYRGERHLSAKLSIADVVDIRSHDHTRSLIKSLSEKYKVDKKTIINARKGISWSHVL